MYYNPINPTSYEQNLRNIIDQATNQLNQIHNQPQPTNLTQNFQLAPQVNNFKVVGSKEEVDKELVAVETFFLAKDKTSLWIKNPRGDIRTFELNEVIQKDEKDLMIEKLQKEIEELKLNGRTNANAEIIKPITEE